MSRRDTIIIAVLINAGLLIVLFASALKTDSTESEFAMQTPAPITPVAELPVRQELAAAGDELDQALGQFSKTTQVSQAPASSVVAEAPANAAPSFADDLQAISQPDAGTSFTTVQPEAAAVEKPAEQKVASGFKEIKVKKGDVLDKIAKRNHTSVEEIMKYNGLTSTRLKIGQPLRIPSKNSEQKIAKAPAAKSAAAPQDGAAKYYTVKNGDNPWTIAVKNHMKVEELLKLNNLNQEKARHLKPGDQLRIK